jgi:hypothetical protein
MVVAAELWCRHNRTSWAGILLRHAAHGSSLIQPKMSSAPHDSKRHIISFDLLAFLVARLVRGIFLRDFIGPVNTELAQKWAA